MCVLPGLVRLDLSLGEGQDGGGGEVIGVIFEIIIEEAIVFSLPQSKTSLHPLPLWIISTLLIKRCKAKKSNDLHCTCIVKHLQSYYPQKN